LFILKGHKEYVHGVAFNREGTRLVSASNDGTMRLWDPALGQELRSLRGHASGVYGVAFSPDGTVLASAGNDGKVGLWDARPLTPDVKADVEAVRLLSFLFAGPLPRSEVRAAIQRDRIIGAAVRRKALEQAERFQEETDPKKYHAAAWPVIRHPH